MVGVDMTLQYQTPFAPGADFGSGYAIMAGTIRFASDRRDNGVAMLLVPINRA